uniref:Uncharacterized protein n=1 Tax=Siphoviridae sp. ctKcB20 TaxID=2827568 RepID=A0A8S5LLN1_9CAUD|nr:MAG TPA: hypothetical protein [Siphoviridae sp. ctKcB20]
MYNSLSRLPTIPYNIMVYLAKSTDPIAEVFWKLLAYKDYKALSHEPLTFQQKMKLVWAQGKQDTYSVFLTNLIEDAMAESKQIVKIYQYYIHASELYTSTVVYAFDCLYGGQMSLVEYNGIPVNRGDLFIHCILTLLNGVEVGGVGKLTFLDDMSRYSAARSTIGNNKTFTGVQLYMAVDVGDTGAEDGCRV